MMSQHAPVRHTTGEVTDARCGKLKGIDCLRLPACRAEPKCRSAKPGRNGRRELHPQPRYV